MIERLPALLSEEIQKACAVGIPVETRCLSIRMNNRLRAVFGRCIRRENGFAIEISGRMAEAPENALRQTIAHELLHTCPGCFDHGPLFRQYADRLNRKYGYAIKRANRADEMGVPERTRTAQYLLICTSCSRQFPRERKSAVVSHPQRYRCPHCGGTLRRVK